MVRSGIVEAIIVTLCDPIYTDPCLIRNRHAAPAGNGQEKMTLASSGDTSLLLGGQDVPPVLEHNPAGRSPFLLTCDHYGRAIPRILGDLGLPAGELTRHIAWDIGIAGLAEALAQHLDAHLIAQRYSRLVIDCNRPRVALRDQMRVEMLRQR